MNRRKFLSTMASSLLYGMLDTIPLPANIPNTNYVILFIIDGARADIVYNMINCGQLPNIKKYLYDHGSVVKHAITSFPSLTLALHPTILTGYFPGHHGIISNVWFDRNTRTMRNYCADALDIMKYPTDLKRSTIFELISDIQTATVFENCNRGADIKKLPVFSTLKLFLEVQIKKAIPLSYIEVDTVAADLTIHLLNKGITKCPQFIVTWFFANDKISHGYGPFSGEAERTLKNVDYQIGRIIQAAKDNQIYNRTTFILTSDHGQSPTKNHWNIQTFIENLGFDVKEIYNPLDVYITEFDMVISPLQDFGGKNELNEFVQKHKEALKPERYDAVVCPSGNSFAQLYFAYKDSNQTTSWTKRPSLEMLKNYPIKNGRVNLVQELRSIPQNQFICVRDSNKKIHIFTSSGEAVIEQFGGKISYNVLSQSDPFDYINHHDCSKLVNSGFHTSDEWLRLSCTTEYPDGPVAISQLFDSPYVGDIIISAATDWELCEDYYPHKGDHGRLNRGDSHVPLIISGHGIKKNILKCARTSDICPTILEMLGYRFDSGKFECVKTNFLSV